jgi:hypothetical protein
MRWRWLLSSGLLVALTTAQVSLDVTGVGTIVVQPGQEPADVVEQFAAQAAQAGHNIDAGAMGQIMAALCKLKKCNRALAPVKLDVTGVGTIVVQPGQEPADVVEQFAAQAAQAGHLIDSTALGTIMKALCKKVRCNRAAVAKRKPSKEELLQQMRALKQQHHHHHQIEVQPQGDQPEAAADDELDLEVFDA